MCKQQLFMYVSISISKNVGELLSHQGHIHHVRNWTLLTCPYPPLEHIPVWTTRRLCRTAHVAGLLDYFTLLKHP